MFTLEDVPADKHIILVSTGTGLAPYMSMLRTRLTCGDERHFAVLHGARHSWDLGYRSELMTLNRMCPNFTYVSAISRPHDEAVPWGGASGYIQDLWKSRPLESNGTVGHAPDNTHIFVCGNPDMIESMVEILETEGYREHTKKEPGQIHVERYWSPFPTGRRSRLVAVPDWSPFPTGRRSRLVAVPDWSPFALGSFFSTIMLPHQGGR